MNSKYRSSDVSFTFDKLKGDGVYKFPYELKSKQLDVLTQILKGESTLAVLPTGYGKSDLFVLAPLLLDILDKERKHISIVIVPLVSLMDDLHRRYSERGVTIYQLRQGERISDEDSKRLKNGDFSILLFQPECVENMELLETFRLHNDFYKNGVCLLAIDEARLLIQWGDKFRPSYGSLGELRSHFDTCPVLLTTATCPPQIKARMLEVMLFAHPDDVKTVALIPDRENIMLYYHEKHPSDIEDCLSWYLDELARDGVKTRKAIIFCRSIRHTGRGFGMRLYKAQQFAFSEGQVDFSHKLIAQYHAEVDEADKKRILDEFRGPDSHIRCLISTVGFGMGIDIPDLQVVIHWGESDTISQYWQEVGRVGRNDNQSEAHLYHRQMQLQLCQSEMKEFVKEIKKMVPAFARQFSNILPWKAWRHMLENLNQSFVVVYA